MVIIINFAILIIITKRVKIAIIIIILIFVNIVVNFLKQSSIIVTIALRIANFAHINIV